MNGTQLYLFGPSYGGLLPAPPRNDVRIGDAAETLVIYRLLMLDYDAHNSRRDAAYDVVVDLHDGRVLRIQVKSCSKAVRGRWRRSNGGCCARRFRVPLCTPDS